MRSVWLGLGGVRRGRSSVWSGLRSTSSMPRMTTSLPLPPWLRRFALNLSWRSTLRRSRGLRPGPLSSASWLLLDVLRAAVRRAAFESAKDYNAAFRQWVSKAVAKGARAAHAWVRRRNGETSVSAPLVLDGTAFPSIDEVVDTRSRQWLTRWSFGRGSASSARLRLRGGGTICCFPPAWKPPHQGRYSHEGKHPNWYLRYRSDNVGPAYPFAAFMRRGSRFP